MVGSRVRKDDTLSSSGVLMTFMVNMFDSQKRSCHFKKESACHPNLTCQSVTLITLICTSMHSTLSPVGSSTFRSSTCLLLLFYQLCVSESITYALRQLLQFQHVTGLSIQGANS